VKGPTDILDHASQNYGWTGKIGFDATKKWKEEGFHREWPDYITMTPEIKKSVAEKMKKAGLVK
jgi:4-hydroxy-3-polyprenylbenzoate decarboxylase